MKWNLLVPDFKLVSLLKSNIISFYYAIFLPGALASEGVKAYRLVNKDHPALDVSCSIFVDKLLGVIGLLFVGSIGIFLSSFYAKLDLINYSLFTISFLAILTIYNLKFFVRLFHGFIKLMVNLIFKRFTSLTKWIILLDEKIFDVENTFEKFFVNKLTVIKVLFFAILSQSVNVLGQYFLAKSLGIELSVFDWAWIFALMSLALLLPISFAGIGIRESSLVGIFAYLGMSAEPALAFSLATYLLLVIYALIGYLTDLFWGVR